MAIVIILVAVLLPVTIQSRNRARAQQCVSNLRQIGDAVALYAQDWSDRVPYLTATPFAGSRPTGDYPEGTSATEARSLLSSRTAGGSVFRCRSDAGSPEFGFASGAGCVFERCASSYVPWCTARAGRFGIRLNGAQTAGLSAPSRLMLFRDYGSDWHGYRGSRGGSVYSVEQANAVYVDGHAGATRTASYATDAGHYTCATSSAIRGSGTIFLNGVSEAGNVELTGTYGPPEGGSGELHLRLSGVIVGAGGRYNIDRVFTFGSGVGMEASVNQVIYWIESVMAA